MPTFEFYAFLNKSILQLLQNFEVYMQYLDKIEKHLTKKSDHPLTIKYHFKFLKISHRYFQHVLPSENYEKKKKMLKEHL